MKSRSRSIAHKAIFLGSTTGFLFFMQNCGKVHGNMDVAPSTRGTSTKGTVAESVSHATDAALNLYATQNTVKTSRTKSFQKPVLVYVTGIGSVNENKMTIAPSTVLSFSPPPKISAVTVATPDGIQVNFVTSEVPVNFDASTKILDVNDATTSLSGMNGIRVFAVGMFDPSTQSLGSVQVIQQNHSSTGNCAYETQFFRTTPTGCRYIGSDRSLPNLFAGISTLSLASFYGYFGPQANANEYFCTGGLGGDSTQFEVNNTSITGSGQNGGQIFGGTALPSQLAPLFCDSKGPGFRLLTIDDWKPYRDFATGHPNGMGYKNLKVFVDPNQQSSEFTEATFNPLWLQSPAGKEKYNGNAFDLFDTTSMLPVKGGAYVYCGFDGDVSKEIGGIMAIGNGTNSKLDRRIDAAPYTYVPTLSYLNQATTNAVRVLGHVHLGNQNPQVSEVGLVANYGGSGDSNYYLATLVFDPAVGYRIELRKSIQGTTSVLATKALPNPLAQTSNGGVLLNAPVHDGFLEFNASKGDLKAVFTV